MHSLHKRILAALLLAVTAGLMLTNARADLAAGIDYLAAQQSAGGGFSSADEPATTVQATAEALRALGLLGATSAVNVSAAVDSLNATQTRNTEYLARRLIANALLGADPQPLITGILQHRNTDGGFGDATGFDSNVLDTAFVLEAVAVALPGGNFAAGPAVGYLLDQQHALGGWAIGDNPPSTIATAIVMRALWHYRGGFADVNGALANAEVFLLAQRDTGSGLWAENLDTALALIALVPNARELSQVQAFLTALETRQLADGSWDNSVYVTALALRALAGRPIPPPPAATTGALAGTVLDASTRLPVTGATVILDSPPLIQPVAANGTFSIDSLDPGGYSLTIGAPGYAVVSVTGISIGAGIISSLGEILLSPSASSGVVRGVVTDIATAEPLADTQISVSGAASATTSTTGSGEFTLVSLPPGAITITVTRNGYLPIVASATVVAGGTLVFNPTLTPTAPGNVPLPGVANSGVVRGVVRDAGTGLALSGVQILVRNADTGISLASQFTDAQGGYELSDIAPANLRIIARRGGFLDAEGRAALQAGNALVFSPALVAIGDDPASGSGAVTQEPLAGTPTTGALLGVVNDAETGLALAGADVVVSGSNALSIQTGADGSYLLSDLAAGPIEVSVALPGYLAATASGTVVAGNSVTFSPALTPENFIAAGVGAVRGRVVESGSQQPLRGVLVSVTGAAAGVSATSDGNGNFQIDALAPGNYTVTFEVRDYRTRSLTAVVNAGSGTDLQSIELGRAQASVSVYGRLADAGSAAPIDRAVVSVLGTAISTLTQSDGRYRIDGLAVGTQTLLFNATGYNGQTFNLSFPAGGEFEVSRNLTLAGNSGIAIGFLATDQSVYRAYQPGLISASVANNGAPVEAMVSFTLLDAGDRLIGRFEGHPPGTNDALFSLPTGSISAASAQFDTANLAPGEYRLIGRVEVGNQLVGPATAILAERVTRFTIEPTQSILDLQLSLAPAFSALGLTQDLELVASLVNRSNVPFTLRLNYALIAPDGAVARTGGSLQLQIDPARESLLQAIDSFSLDLDQAGIYRLDANAVPTPQAVTAGTLSVAPGLRIDPSQSLTPGLVAPDADQKVRINIRLQGREQR